MIRVKESLPIEGAFVIAWDEERDSRGHATSLRWLGMPFVPVAELLVFSKELVVRGLHYQRGLSKIVRCVRGIIVDVGVDLRISSPTFGQHYSYALGERSEFENDWGEAIFVPEGVAHGICVLYDEPAEVLYQFSAPHAPALEGAVKWDDPELAVDWQNMIDFFEPMDKTQSQPRGPFILSDRDRNAPSFADYKKNPVFP